MTLDSMTLQCLAVDEALEGDRGKCLSKGNVMMGGRRLGSTGTLKTVEPTTAAGGKGCSA